MLNLEKKKEMVKNKFEKFQFNNTISIHFRIGDYIQKNLGHFHPILSIEYYIDSIETIMKKTNKSFDILYFYEQVDAEMIQKNINILKNRFIDTKFISIDTNLIDYEQMLVMSLCKHNVIANSSFSWWGAYLNSNIDKIVIYPSIWFGPRLKNNDTKDLFPSTWFMVCN